MHIRSAATTAAAVTAVTLGITAVLAAPAYRPAAAAAVPAKPGDFNGDGRRDLAIGSPLGTSGGVRTGFVTVVFGGTAGPDTARRQVLTQNSAGLPGTATADNAFARPSRPPISTGTASPTWPSACRARPWTEPPTRAP